jgi:hypothetical protein
MRGVSLDDLPFAFEDEDLVLVGMAVPRRESADADLELPHGEVRSPILLADQPADGAALRALHRDRLLGDRFVMIDFHGCRVGFAHLSWFV